MAKFYWGVNRGQHETDVQSGTSDPSTDIEVSIDLTKVDVAGGMSRQELVEALESKIMNAIMKGNWPPA